jgi:anhydro-N-acetylmuramic acid kinase
MPRFIGLMSGTSLDGVDAVLADLPAADTAAPALRLQPRVLASTHLGFPPALHAELLALNRPGDNEIHRAALAGNALARLYAAAVAEVLAKAGLAPAGVRALGAHGQTVRHRPAEFDGSGYTTQLLNGALLAELCGIDVVCDFRSRDLAAGGQGAPLVPAFHARCFAAADEDVAVLNLGGIANLTLLPTHGPVSGFDTGPGNVLMDLWCRQQRGLAYDADGAWAAGGQVDAPLLSSLLAEPYFQRQPPKSTGRDLFNTDWLQQRLAPHARVAAQDVMATLAELTAISVMAALLQHLPSAGRLLVCGGGAHNGHLQRRLLALRPGLQVQSTAEAGMPPDQVEALAFAWLAQAALARQPGNMPAVTGARGPRVLGAIYPAA